MDRGMNYPKLESELLSLVTKATQILREYSEARGVIVRSTSDLSPLEEWLIDKLIEARRLL